MPLNRRQLLKWSIRAAAVAPLGGTAYAYAESGWLEVMHRKVAVPRLPAPFQGLRVVVLTDIHHGPQTPLSFIRRAVDEAMASRPDVIALVGDFVAGKTGQNYFNPCFAELSRLAAPLGVYCVPGNHDYWEDFRWYHAALHGTTIRDVKNHGAWLHRGGARLRLAGVDDLWCGRPNLDRALADARDHDTAILLCHNPDFVETLTDSRVSLVLSGHTHGGQLRVPFYSGQVPSQYGTKYLKGLVQGPTTQVYVSRGIGTVSVPLRFRSRPEVTVLQLASG